MKVSSRAYQAFDSTGNSKRAWLLALVISLATALIIVSPFFWKGNASGHDFSFHAASWMDVAGQWQDGILLPRWTEGANHGFGEPRFIFYPPLSWMLGAALSFLVPWIYVPAVFIVFTQTVAGLSAFALARRLLPQKIALICVAVYAANPYTLLIVYMRSDFAEQLAVAFFPLLTLAALEVLGLAQLSQRSTWRSVSFLAIMFAAVWLANAPAAVLASYSLAAIFIFSAITSKSWRPLIQGGAGLALGLDLAGFYLAPAIHEQSWVNITQALASGLQPSQNFLYSVIADAEHNVFNRIASNTALLMISSTAIFVAATFHRGDEENAPYITKPVRSLLVLLFASSAFLMLPISNVFWIALPKLRFVQFPWRGMSILAIPFACLFTAAISRNKMRRRWIALTATALAVVLAGTGGWLVQHTWWDTEDIPVLLEAIRNDEGFEGVDEYDPAGDDHSDLPEKYPRMKLLHPAPSMSAVSGARIHVEHWSAEQKELRVTSREPSRLALRLLNYPSWRVEVNDNVVIPERLGDSGQMIVPLASGQSRVVVRFMRTPDRTIGAVVTALSLVILIFLATRPEETTGNV
jgi:6-pyruvoyl-tetrahydropterin synthase related domain